MNKYVLISSSKFKKDLKKYKNNPKDLIEIKKVLTILLEDGMDGIPKNMKPHKLIGNYKGLWECHILTDLLLNWEENEELKEILLIRLGTHSELFK